MADDVIIDQLAELSSGEGDTDPSLFPGAQTPPFSPDDSIYGNQGMIPFADNKDIQFNTPSAPQNQVIETSAIDVRPPQVVEENTFEQDLLNRWKAEEDAIEYQRWRIENTPKVARIGLEILEQNALPGFIPATAALSLIREEEYKKELEKKYQWLNGEPFPAWEDFRNSNYPDWNNLTLPQQKEVFNYWTNSTAEYWVGLNGVSREEFTKSMDVAREGGLLTQLQDFTNKEIGEDGKWLEDNVPWTLSAAFDESVVDEEAIQNRTENTKNFSQFRKSFDAKQADILANKSNALMRRYIEGKNVVQQWGTLSTEGKVTKESIAEARKNLTDDFYELEGSTDPEDIKEQAQTRARFTRDMAALDFIDSSKDVEGEISRYNEAFQRYRRISQNFQLLSSPEVRKIIASRDAGELWDNIWNNKGSAFAYYAGEAASQMVETAPDLGVGIAVGGIIGVPIAGPAIASGSAGAEQEIDAVIPALIMERMQQEGLNPSDPESWEYLMKDESFYQDVQNQAYRKGFTTAAVESVMTGLFGHVLKLLPKSTSGLWKNAALFSAKRTGELAASSLGAASGEIAGQKAQSPSEPVDWKEVLHEVLAEFPSQTQQTIATSAAEGFSSIYGKPKQSTSDSTVSEQPSTGSELTLDAIEREVGKGSIPKDTKTPSEESLVNAALAGRQKTPSGISTTEQIESSTGVVKEGEAKSAQDSASFFSTLPAPKNAFESAQTILDNPDAKILTDNEAKQSELLSQLSPAEREAFRNYRFAKIIEQQKAQQAIREDENYRKNLIRATREIGAETSPVETSKGKGMSVQESNRRNQGGFVDLESIYGGIHEFAVDTFANVKDFGSWAGEMVKRFSNSVVPHLERIWNSMASAVSWAKDYFTFIDRGYDPKAKVKFSATAEDGSKIDVELEAAQAERFLDRKKTLLQAVIDCMNK